MTVRRKDLLTGMVIGAAISAGVLLMLMTLSGCGLKNVAMDYLADNPDANIVMIDDDGDGLADALGVDQDGDGKADTDETGTAIEVPESREHFAEATAADTGLETILALVAALVPITGVGATLVARLKPAKRIAHHAAMATGLVKSVENIRLAAKKNKLSLEDMNKLLYEVQKNIPGMIDTVREIKAAIADCERG